MTETTKNIDTLAATLQNTLGSSWKVSGHFDRIIAVTPFCDRIEITPLDYNYTDVRWALVPMQRSVAPVTVREIPGYDVTPDVTTGLRALSYRHHALPAAA